MPVLTKWFAARTATQPAPRAATDLLDPQAIAEYRHVARSVGVSETALEIEEFRIFLDKHDLPVFNRSEIVKYMDGVARRDNPTGLGWHWCPVRERDARIGATFGTPSTLAEHIDHTTVSRTVTSRSAASDYYSDKTQPYTRVMPLHALRKIALIEREFQSDAVRFLVSDYVLVPHVVTKTVVLPPPPRINPDPFLMAVVPNGDVGHGVGTFVIDVWDEPGFGLQQRLAPAGG
jgi:hypothetical protein